MSKVFFFCDESGSKGYAARHETIPGEVGVFAGILVPHSSLSNVQPVFDAIAQKYTPSTGKLHITELSAEKQEALRQDVYNAIRTSGLPCFWYAIHVEGLHQHHVTIQAISQQASAAQKAGRAGVQPRIKSGSPREEPASMHVELFAGLYGHVVAFLLERGQSMVELEIRTDQVDTPIVKRFEEVAERLLSSDPEVAKSTGFDTVAKKVVTGSVTVTVKWPEELDLAAVVSSISINTVPDSDGLVLAADVLANSLNYLFLKRDTQSLYAPLNCPEAVKSHPLADHLDTFHDWGQGDFVGDGIYRHPQSRDEDSTRAE